MPPRPKKPSEKTSSRLLEVVRFLSLVSRDEGSPQDTHILIKDKTATAFNGTIGAGCIIEEDLTVAPHTKTFLNALMKCGEHYTLTQLDNKLSIKSGPFKAIIPCIDPTLLCFPTPDANIAPIDDKFKEALSIVEKVKPENGQKIFLVANLLNGPSIIAKALIPVILDSKKLIGFGISQSTVTFYLEDNSFIRSQLYAEAFPDLASILNRPSTPITIPDTFFKGLDAIKEFSINGFVYFEDGKLLSRSSEGIGAEFEIPELKKGPVYSIKYLSLIKDIAEKIDFYVPAERDSSMISFVGKGCRGVLMGYA